MSYSVYSKFDIDKHAATFINYLEVVIDENGEIHYAVPSHQMFMENILKRKMGEEEFNRMIMEDKEAWYDYLPWLCKHTKCVPVWNEFYFGKPNDKQLQKLQQLKERKLYKGEINARDKS